MSEKHFIGLDLTGFEDNGEARSVSRVTLILDDDNAFTAGDDSGLELTAECPHATQAMADAILAAVKGYKYKMYSATAANLDPAAELGDGITAGGIYSVISSISDDGSGYPDLEAAGEAELEDEFPTEGPMTQTFNRKIADTRAAITKTAEEIRLEVTQGDEANKSYIDQTAASIRAEVAAGDSGNKSYIDQTAASIRAEVTAGDSGNKSYIDQTAAAIRQEVSNTAAGLQASITVNANAIEQRVSKNGVISAINQSAEKITIQAGKISLEGLVTVNKTFQIDAQGYLRCSGGTIGGYTIDATRLYSGGTGISNNTGQYVFWAGETNGQIGSSLTDAPFRVGGDGILRATGAVISGNINATSGTFESVTIKGSTFSGSLSSATGSISGVTGSYAGSINSGGTFSGTHSGGSLSGTYGSFYGSHYNGTLSSCSTGGTTLTVAGGSLVNHSGYVCVSSGGTVYINSGYGYHTFTGSNLTIPGKFTAEGGKSRLIRTDHFGARLLYAYETPLPTFSDYGEATLDETGVCYICIDPIFAETVNERLLPAVFLTPYGEGTLYVGKIEHDVVTVKGTPGLGFAWEARYAQTNAEVLRLGVNQIEDWQPEHQYNFDQDAAIDLEHTAPDMAVIADDYLTSYLSTAVDYGLSGYEYYTEFERSMTAA